MLTHATSSLNTLVFPHLFPKNDTEPLEPREVDEYIDWYIKIGRVSGGSNGRIEKSWGVEWWPAHELMHMRGLYNDKVSQEGALSVMLNGSFLRGPAMLEGLMRMEVEDPGKIALTGLCTDDSTSRRALAGTHFLQPNIHEDVRVYQYVPYNTRLQYYNSLKMLADRAGLILYNGSLQCPRFTDEILPQLNPDVMLVGTFGQIIRPKVFFTQLTAALIFILLI